MCRRRVVALIFLLGVLAAACGGAAVEPATTGDPPEETTSTSTFSSTGPVTVVVLGSSTALGEGATDPFNAWVRRYRASLVQQEPANEVVNLAVEGITTAAVLPTGTSTGGRGAVDPEHNITAALALSPDAVIVNLPTNDTADGYSPDESLRNLQTVFDAASEAGVPVWISTPQPRALDATGRQALLALKDLVVSTFGDRALDFWSGVAAFDGSIDDYYDSGDGIHLNDEGHRVLADVVLAADIPTAVAVANGLDRATTTVEP